MESTENLIAPPQEQAESTAMVDATPVQFPEVTMLRPCSTLICTNGHEWSPMLALARCGYGTPNGWNGCGTPMLALKMSSCPRCQEPIAEFRLRIDITPPTPFPVPLCIPGSKTGAESLCVVIKPNYWRETEAVETAKQAEALSDPS